MQQQQQQLTNMMMLFIIFLQLLSGTLVRRCNGAPSNIKRLDNIPRDVKELLQTTYPFIVPRRNLSVSQVIQTITEASSFIQNYGDQSVRLSSSNAYSHGRLDSTIKDYILSLNGGLMGESLNEKSSLPADQIYYLFGENYDGIWQELSSLYSVDYCDEICNFAGAKSFGIGGTDSGVSFHFHGPGFAEIIHGAKQWFFFPPSLKQLVNRLFNIENMTTKTWYDCYYHLLHHIENQDLEVPMNNCPFNITSIDAKELLELQENLYECIIYPNELLFFPSDWMHATLNLNPYNVFVSTFIDSQLVQMCEAGNSNDNQYICEWR